MSRSTGNGKAYHDIHMSCCSVTKKGTQCTRLKALGAWCKQHGGAVSDTVWSEYGVQLSSRLAKDPTFSRIHGDVAINTLPPHFLFDNESNNRKYLKWSVMSYLNNGIKKYEDILSRLHPAITDFNTLIQKRVLKKGAVKEPWTNEADINNYCGLIGCSIKGRERPGLEDILRKYEAHLQVSSSEEGRTLPFYTGTTLTVYEPKTKQQSIYYGRRTTWCTASTKSENMFDTYFARGSLYIIVPKAPQRKDEKYQLHVPKDGSDVQFMDETDNRTYKEDIPALYPELVKLGFAESIPSKIKLKTDSLLVFNDEKIEKIENRFYVKYKEGLYYFDPIYMNHIETDRISVRDMEGNETQLSDEILHIIAAHLGAFKEIDDEMIYVFIKKGIQPDISGLPESKQRHMAITIMNRWPFRPRVASLFCATYPKLQLVETDIRQIEVITPAELDTYTKSLNQMGLEFTERMLDILVSKIYSLSSDMLNPIMALVSKKPTIMNKMLKRLSDILVNDVSNPFKDIERPKATFKALKAYDMEFTSEQFNRIYASYLKYILGASGDLYLLMKTFPNSIPTFSREQMDIIKKSKNGEKILKLIERQLDPYSEV